MYEVYALEYGERDTTACQLFYRKGSHEPITLHENIIVTGHDPEVAERFEPVEPGIIRVA